MAPSAVPRSKPTRSHLARSSEGENTRQILLDAAEELFARYGPEAVSIRSVNSAVGLAPAAVHYHFGSKDGLVLAVLRRRGTAVWQRHEELLDALEARPGRIRSRELVEALAQPLVELLETEPIGGPRWIQVAARLAQARDPLLESVNTRSGSIRERFHALVCTVYPDVSEAEALMRWNIAGNTVLRQLADADTPAAHAPGEHEARVSGTFIAALIDFTASGLAGLRHARRPSATPAKDVAPHRQPASSRTPVKATRS